MLKIIIGRGKSGKTSFMINEIKKYWGNLSSFFMLVPEQYSHASERELAKKLGSSLPLYGEVLSFSRLSYRTSQEMGNGKKLPLDRGAKLLTMTLALELAYENLRLYKKVAKRAVFQESLLKAIEQLKMANISSDNLREAAQNFDLNLKEKLMDLALCLDCYNLILAQGHSDSASALAHTAKVIGKSSLCKKAFFIDGFTDFTAVELDIIKALIGAKADISIALTLDSLNSDFEHFDVSRKTALLLIAMAKDLSCDYELIELEKENSNEVFDFLGNNLYSYSEKTLDAQGKIAIYQGDSIRSECEKAAELCLSFVREKGLRFRDITIAVRGFKSYEKPLAQIFNLYNIPLFFSKKDSILQKPLPNFVSAVYKVFSSNYQCFDVLNYIKTGFTGLDLDICDKISSYANLWSIKGELWQEDIIWQESPKSFGASIDEESAKLLEEINAGKNLIIAPLRKLENAHKNAHSAKAHALALSEFFQEIELPQTLEIHGANLENFSHKQDCAQFFQLWEILVSALEQFSSLLLDMPMEFQEFSKLFLRMLSQYDVSAIPISLDMVNAGEMDRIGSREIKELIILGASDDNIPSIAQNDGIFSDDDLSLLSQNSLNLSYADPLCRELFLIYNCLMLPKDGLSLSYSTKSPSNAPLRPSFLVKRLQELFKLNIKAIDLNFCRLSSKETAFMLAINKENDPSIALSKSYFENDENSKKRMADIALRLKEERKNLEPSTVTKLFGKNIHLSPTQAQSYNSCPFMYFLKHGLKLNDREKAGFNPPELGTFVHYILEACIKEISEKYDFKTIDEETVKKMCSYYVDLYIKERLNSFSGKSSRFRYLFNRLRPKVFATVLDTIRELSRSHFRPSDFEFAIRRGGGLSEIPLGEDGVFMGGIVDRIDCYENDEKLFVRVVDYKAKGKKLDFSDIYQGLGLQMLVYLFALEEKDYLKKDKPLVPSGVLYVPNNEKILSMTGLPTKEEVEAAREKEKRRNGLVLKDLEVIKAMEFEEEPIYMPYKLSKDGSYTSEFLLEPKEFSALKTHVKKKLSELGHNIKDGKIPVSPLHHDPSNNTCTYCSFQSVCRFKEGIDKRRYLKKLNHKEFFEQLEKEENK